MIRVKGSCAVSLFDYEVCLLLSDKQETTAPSGDNVSVVQPDPDYPEDHVIETEEDWMGDNPIAGTSKFSEAIAAEVRAVSFCFQSDNFFHRGPFRIPY